MSFVEATIEPGRKHLGDGIMLEVGKLPKVLVILVESKSISVSEAKSEMRQFLATRYPADLEGSQAAATEEVLSIDGLPSDLEGEIEWDLADLTEGTSMGGLASMHGPY